RPEGGVRLVATGAVAALPLPVAFDRAALAALSIIPAAAAIVPVRSHPLALAFEEPLVVTVAGHAFVVVNRATSAAHPGLVVHPPARPVVGRRLVAPVTLLVRHGSLVDYSRRRVHPACPHGAR